MSGMRSATASNKIDPAVLHEAAYDLGDHGRGFKVVSIFIWQAGVGDTGNWEGG